MNKYNTKYRQMNKSKTVKELKKDAKKMGIRGFSRMLKGNLINSIKNQKEELIASQIPIEIIFHILSFISEQQKYELIVFCNLKEYFDYSDLFWVACVKYNRYGLLSKLPNGYHRKHEEIKMSHNLYVPAVASGNMRMIAYLKEKKIGFMSGYLVYVACKNGRLDVLKLLRSYGIVFGNYTYFYASTNYHFDICKWLIKKRYLDISDIRAIPRDNLFQ